MSLIRDLALRCMCVCHPAAVQTFMQTLDQGRSSGALSPTTLAVMGRLCSLFGLGLVEGGLADLLEGGWIAGEWIRLCALCN